MIEVLKVSGVSVDAKDFVRREGEDNYITTTALPSYLSEWERKENLLPKQTRRVHYRRQQHIIMLSMFFRLYQMSNRYWKKFFPSFNRPEERYKVALPLSIQMSIAILGETLDRAARKGLGLQNLAGGGFYLDQNLIDELKARGWCRSEISLVRQSLDDTSAFFASQLERQRLKADHSRCSVNKCLAFKCLAFSAVTEQYKTKHVVDCPGCRDIGIDIQELASILRQGQIPRAFLQVTDSSGTSEIKVKIGASGPYVAVSHVWSDGLGNPNANSLPACQLLRLHRAAASLKLKFAEGIPAVWIDSLLVPVEKGYEKRLALSRLCDYYQVAEKVLVLDSDLLHASQAYSKEEIMTRIFFSTWMRRLWTLEECILNRENLEFQFRDGTVSMSHLSHPIHFSSSITKIGGKMDELLEYNLPKLANYYQRPCDSIQRQFPILAELLPTLDYRSTSKAVDETLCLAHILGLDTSRLLLTDDVYLRMEIFIEMLAERNSLFPMWFLFTDEPKLPLDGLRWAPSSFMSLDRDDIESLPDDEYPRHWTGYIDKGLLIHGMNGFNLPFGNDTLKRVTFAEVDSRIYAVTPRPVGKSCRGAGRFWSRQAFDKIDPNQHWNTELQGMLGKTPHSLAILRVPGDYGILVSMYDCVGKPDDLDGSLIYARPISQVYVQELKTTSQNYFAINADSAMIKFTNPDWDFNETEKQMHEALEKTFEPETSTFLRCRGIDPSQRWCIG